jgi:DNA-binding transcriptional ArsR family regulator
MNMNVSSIEEVARLMQSIDQPVRLQILLAIGEGETCVCHLEATFGWRQAYLSQHLMALREKGIVLARREGRFIHYRMANPALLDLIHETAKLLGTNLPQLSPSASCGCSNCRRDVGGAHEENHSRNPRVSRHHRVDAHTLLE